MSRLTFYHTDLNTKTMDVISTPQNPATTLTPATFPFVVRSLLLTAWVLLSFLTALNAQQLDWVQQASGTGFQEARSTAVDNEGNVFVVGTFEGTTGFGAGSNNLNAVGVFDVFFAKYGPAGNLLWAKRIGGTGVDLGYGIAHDAAGNVYIAGNFMGTADFDPGAGTANLSSFGNFDAFFAKYDTDGNLLWAHHVGGAMFEEARCIATDASGNVVIAGIFSGVADFDPSDGIHTCQSISDNDVYFAKYTPAGDLLWVKQLAGTGSERVLGMTIGHSGHLYLAGHFQETVDFDPSGAIGNRSVVGDSDLFFARYDGDGNLVWAKSVGGFFYEEVRGIAVDRLDNVYITGRYGETVDFDPGPGISELDNAGINDAFFAKYDASGNLTWAKKIGGEGNDIGNSVAVDTLGRVYLSGQFMNTVDFDPGDNTSDMTGPGDIDIFLAQYDASGNFIWAKSIGGTQMEESTAIALDARGNLYLTGFFKGIADFDPGPDATNLTSSGKEDAFIAKYSAPATITHEALVLNARAYPVPAADVLHIALPGHAGEVHCAVFDLTGRMLLAQQGEGENTTVDLSGFDNGVFYLQIRTAQGAKSLPFEILR